jgi:hypothetical protein
VLSRPHTVIEGLRFAAGAGEGGLALAFRQVAIVFALWIVRRGWPRGGASRDKKDRGKERDLQDGAFIFSVSQAAYGGSKTRALPTAVALRCFAGAEIVRVRDVLGFAGAICR